MKLEGKKIAILVADLFEDIEFYYPYYRMKEEGADVVVIGADKKQFRGKHGLTAEPDRTINDVKSVHFDAVIIPGGYSPDHMRRSPAMVEFVAELHKQGNIVAAICHGGWMLASADIIQGAEVTSFYSIKDDLEHAGANWVDLKVVKYENIITSRNPDDLPAFCTAIIEAVNYE